MATREKSRTSIEQKGRQPKTAKENSRSSSHKAGNNLEGMDVDRAEAKKRLEFTPTEDKEKKKPKQEAQTKMNAEKGLSTFKTARPVMKKQNNPGAKAPTQVQKQKHARPHLPHKQCQR